MGVCIGMEVSSPIYLSYLFATMLTPTSYAIQWLIILPLELIAASLTLSYWSASINKLMFVTIFLILIIFINSFGVRGYAEAEFVFSSIKVVAVISFM